MLHGSNSDRNTHVPQPDSPANHLDFRLKCRFRLRGASAVGEHFSVAARSQVVPLCCFDVHFDFELLAHQNHLRAWLKWQLHWQAGWSFWFCWGPGSVFERVQYFPYFTRKYYVYLRFCVGTHLVHIFFCINKCWILSAFFSAFMEIHSAPLFKSVNAWAIKRDFLI